MICFFVKRFWYKKIKYAFSRLFNLSNIFWSMKCGAIIYFNILKINSKKPRTAQMHKQTPAQIEFALIGVFIASNPKRNNNHRNNQTKNVYKIFMNIFLFNKNLAHCVQSIQNKHALKSRPQDPVNVKWFSWFLLLV